VQTKILESLALGTPVVTTTMGAEGLEPSIMAVADSPREFARATVELMQDPHTRRERAIAGRAYIEKHCTWEKSLEGLDSLLEGPAADPTALQSSPA
jgi:glycosyltransferase involved in cell wall biosynthesis